MNAPANHKTRYPDLKRVGRGMYRRLPAGGTGPAASRRPSRAIEAATRPRQRRQDRARANVEALIVGFLGYVERFEASNAFPGPSLYFHERAIERRRAHRTVEALLADERFLEYVYAVLPAWGMHRMGKQAAKVGDFGDMTASLRAAARH